jgi:photoactive yellow protein
MAGVAPDAAEGKNFFTQVAPCTNNRLVFGRFKEGVGKGELDAEFNYTFTYKMKPTNVTIRLLRHAPSRSNWVLVSKK